MPKTGFPDSSYLGGTCNLALRLHVGSDGVAGQAGLGSRKPHPLALSKPRLHGLGSVVLLRPVTHLSSS